MSSHMNASSVEDLHCSWYLKCFQLPPVVSCARLPIRVSHENYQLFLLPVCYAAVLHSQQCGQRQKNCVKWSLQLCTGRWPAEVCVPKRSRSVIKCLLLQGENSSETSKLNLTRISWSMSTSTLNGSAFQNVAFRVKIETMSFIYFICHIQLSRNFKQAKAKSF